MFWTKVFKRSLEYATFRFDNENVTNKLIRHHHHLFCSIIQTAIATISAHIEQDRKALIEHQ